jgi:hypothetical protein
MCFLNNYNFLNKELLFAGVTLTGGVLAERHWYMSDAMQNFSLRWGHRLVALIESLPGIGAIAACIELFVKKCFYNPAPPSPSNPPTPITSKPDSSSVIIAKTSHSVAAPQIDLSARECKFHEQFKKAGFFSVPHPLGNGVIKFDLREICHEEYFPDSVIYAPFRVRNEYGYDSPLYGDLNEGWLKLQPDHIRRRLIVCRLDNFAYGFGLSCRKDGKISGIGSALIQFAIEKSIELGFNGNLTLVSTNGSGLFYAKIGFIAEFLLIQETLEKALRDGVSITIDGGEMYLSEESLANWKKKIEQSPINCS